VPDDVHNPLTGRHRLAAGIASAVVLLGAVAALAAFTGGPPGKTVLNAPTGPSVGAVHPGPRPPVVVFAADSGAGYALYDQCDRQPAGDGCAAQLWRTPAVGGDWEQLQLPPDAPVDGSAWRDLSAHGTDVLVTWATGSAVSTDSGGSFHDLRLVGQTSEISGSEFLVGNQYVVDPATLTMAAFIPPPNLQLSGSGGQLPDGNLWLWDNASYGMSFDKGRSWNAAALTDGDVPLPPLIGYPDHWARLSGPATAGTTGIPGDGGELPAAHALFSSNQGTSWATTMLGAGPAADARCAAYTKDGSLLAVAVDGSGLLRLAKGGSAFRQATDGPAQTPVCLQGNGKLIWGATLDHHLVTSTDGHHWAVDSIPVAAAASATPSPAPGPTK
jgi:hypothetical protein